ncbi:OPT family small oligopeptide transporter [Hesseltinella vesiculosa]|uniref:OPT family small oligopeptide transporter n=1 Tax=Hesseltinella vesiculosa TaxID=101127 RepID=A0A1X2GP29_9FUNG|nr:OPT family small oligopeptide transporter [Hesseltinella vesiculosa]
MEYETKVEETYQSKTEETVEYDQKRQYDEYFEKDTEQVKVGDFEEEDSPIEEVRAVVPNTDDPSLPVYTFRMWFLGIMFTGALGFVNQFFYYRKNQIQVSSLVVQLLSFPLGKAMEFLIPKSRFFNPGPFNLKEHVLIATMANCAFNTAYAIDIITIQKIFYKQDIGWGGGILLIWTTQFIGYGFAGFLRPYLVYPSTMVFPSNLSQMALFRSLHLKDSNWTGPSRLRWFLYMFTFMFVYYWIPGYFFSVLSFFSWVCWIAPNNIVLGQLTGTESGLGILGLGFDWSTISGFLLSPLVVPWWAIANITVGFVFIAWILAPALYYTDVWDAKTFPIITSRLFTTDGSHWNITKVMNPDNTLNEAAYATYGPLRMSTFFAITYGIGFAGITSILTHTYLYHGKEIWTQFKRSRSDNEDIHRKLMRAYPEVPFWWYGFTFVASLGISFAVLYNWPEMQLPWWGMFLAMAICVVFLLPIGIITAITNQTPGLNVITEFIIGFAYPGHPIANVTFKTYGYISMVQCIQFVADLKLGHYAKTPPRAMFWVQIVGTAIAGIVNLGVARWLMESVQNICYDEGFPFTCPSANTFYSASIIWGAIGPQRMFGPGELYNPTLYFFLIGFLLPIPFYLLSKRYPNSWIRYVHIPLIFNATGMMPPAMPINFSMWCLTGFIFMYVLRKYRHEWWRKYNYVTSAAFDTGLAISTLIIFGVVSGSGYQPVWWGNGGADINGTPDNCPFAGANFNGD